MKLLIVEDDTSLLKVISTVFKDDSYEVDCAQTGDDGLALALNDVYDGIILDIMLPGIDGLSIVKKLRTQSISTPILLLTARDSIDDRVKGLNYGADDYLVKPFAVPELLARIKAILRRTKGEMEKELSYGPITLQSGIRDGLVNGHALGLTGKEFELLEFLLLNSERILKREQIFYRIWGFDSDAGTNIVDVFVHLLRKKMAVHTSGDYIKTIRGVGYMLKGDKPDV